MQVGWQYLNVSGGGSGYLANGGSYVTLVSPTDARDFTLVIEKLQGACLRCSGQTTSAELVTVQLQVFQIIVVCLLNWFALFLVRF